MDLKIRSGDYEGCKLTRLLMRYIFPYSANCFERSQWIWFASLGVL